MKVVGIIPARYSSSRFPGKPLALINGTPMIELVVKNARRTSCLDEVIVATDNAEIFDFCQSKSFECRMTSSTALTGTDRVAEVASTLRADAFVNIQGDEPMVTSEDIERVVKKLDESPDSVVQAYCNLDSEEEIESRSVPKLVTNEKGRILYISRAAIPKTKVDKAKPGVFKRQVCIYGFKPYHLGKFLSFGRKSYLEMLEDIELLRFFELDIKLIGVELQNSSLAVDYPEDIKKVERALSRVSNDKS